MPLQEIVWTSHVAQADTSRASSHDLGRDNVHSEPERAPGCCEPRRNTSCYDGYLAEEINGTLFWDHAYTPGGLGSRAYPGSWLDRTGFVRAEDLAIGDILVWPSDLIHCKPLSQKGRVVLYCMFRPVDSNTTAELPYYNWQYLARRTDKNDDSTECYDLFKRHPMALCTGYSAFTERLMDAWNVPDIQRTNLMTQAASLLKKRYNEKNIGRFKPTLIELPDDNSETYQQFLNTLEVQYVKRRPMRIVIDSRESDKWNSVVEHNSVVAGRLDLELSVPKERVLKSALRRITTTQRRDSFGSSTWSSAVMQQTIPTTGLHAGPATGTTATNPKHVSWNKDIPTMDPTDEDWGDSIRSSASDEEAGRTANSNGDKNENDEDDDKNDNDEKEDKNHNDEGKNNTDDDEHSTQDEDKHSPQDNDQHSTQDDDAREDGEVD